MILLSGEETSLPEAEARAVVKTYDEDAKVSLLEPRIVRAETEANPDIIARRIAFAKRVGTLIPDGVLDRETRREVERASYRLRHFKLGEARADRSSVETKILNQLHGKVKLEDPEYELSVIEGRRKGRTYLLLSKPGIMNQGWARRRPRSRAFFHPSAIFPKLSRALVNIAGVKEGETLLDPFAGTGSILLEASIVGALPVGVDISWKMARGALANAQKYRQPWLGMIRADSGIVTLDGEPVVAEPEPRVEPEVVRVTGGEPVPVTRWRRAPGPFPVDPVRRRRRALALRRRRRGAPEEAVRPRPRRHPLSIS